MLESETTKRLENAIIAATNAPEMRTKIETMGYLPTGTTSDALREFQRADFERWGRVVAASGFEAKQ